MTWITLNSLMIASGAILASGVTVDQLVKCCMLLHRRMKVKDYNKFVDITFSQYGKETPAIILRIQNDYILRYNNLLKYCRFLSVFFKEIGYSDGTPGGASLFPAGGEHNGEEPARWEGV